MNGKTGAMKHGVDMGLDNGMHPEKYLPLMKGALLRPAKIFGDVREETARTILGYGLGIICLNLILTFLLGTTGRTPGLQVPAVVASLLAVPLGALWLHLWIYAAGGREGMGSTFRLVLVALTPAALLGWMPGVALFGFLWSLVILFVGLREMYHIPAPRAAAVLLLTCGISLVLPAVIAMLPGFTVFWPTIWQVTWV
ncbi:MAG: YIP1 family protein [Methanofollis sp.]|uniref:YIP1 family protein n=1 Tax=Methanofollis sp. TaxID=2052835 RepID=UPI00261078B1|nr:YIP1 family protein [Methanofollis sp.]MDD4254529.1 YIP1 family protein [Methanofollis sp.]